MLFRSAHALAHFAVINNIGTVTRTLSPLDADSRKVAAAQAHLVSLLSVFNCLGRLASGFVSDFFLHQAPLHLRCARVWWLGTISMKGKDRCHFTHRCSICSADFGPLCPFASAGELDRRGRLYRPQLSAKFDEVSPGRRMVRLNTADCRDWVSSTRLMSVRNG